MEADRLNDMGARGHVLHVHLMLLLSGRWHFLEEPADVGGGKAVLLEVLASPDSDVALEPGVVAEDPTISLLRIPKGMAGEPLNP